MSTTVYKFDPTMSNAANVVRNEQHVITSVNFRDYHYVIPNFAPFFAENLTIKMQYPNGTTRPMIEGKDYYLGFQFMDASATTNHPLYGAIEFLDTDTEGVLTITYNTVGGKWTLTPQRILEILANNLRNPRITSWEQVENPPERFPPIDHPHDIVDFKTMTDVQLSVDRVRDAILANSGGGLAAHIGNYANPHNVTKAQVGLGSVLNYGIATTIEAQAGTGNVKYMTPLRVKEAIDVLAANLVDLHANRTDNPHGTTKTHVGLSAVQNYGIATQQEAVAGVVANKYMTPERVMNVVSITNAALATHMADFDNPHKVTKDHVGLFNVQNYPVASQEEARAGSLNDRYMTPLRTTQLVAEYVYTAMRTHSDRTDNPHGVSKQQVGLGNVMDYPIATLDEAQAGARNDRYVTPYLVKQSIGAISGELGNHATDTNNPHGVTKAQVGLSAVQNYGVATVAQVVAGTATNLYLTPASLATLRTQIAGDLTSHTGRTDNPHGVTKSQVGLSNVQDYAVATATQVLAGTANNLYVTPGSLSSLRSQITTDLNGHAGRTDNPHAVTAAQVGAYSTWQMSTILADYLLKTETAPNSILWNGRNELAYGNWLNAQSGIAFNAMTLDGMGTTQLVDSVLARVGASYANQLNMQRIGSASSSTEAATQYWVKIHEISYADMYDGDARDGVAMIVGGSTSKAGVDWTVGQNAIILRTSARSVQTGGQLVECSTLTPTNIGSTMRVGYVLDTTAKKLTTYIQTRRDASDLLVTEFGNIEVLVGDTEIPLTAAPAGIVYITPRNVFTEASAATTAASGASTAASTAQTTANAANTAASGAQTTANSAQALGNQNKIDTAALTTRVADIEAILAGITVS